MWIDPFTRQPVILPTTSKECGIACYANHANLFKNEFIKKMQYSLICWVNLDSPLLQKVIILNSFAPLLKNVPTTAIAHFINCHSFFTGILLPYFHEMHPELTWHARRNFLLNINVFSIGISERLYACHCKTLFSA